MLRSMCVAVCGVAIIFSCCVSTKAAARPKHFAPKTQLRAGKTDPSPLIGAASTYNPFRPDPTAGGKLTASGEDYSEDSWTAAIQTKLRRFFGGVFWGKSYRPRFALVETKHKRAVVKINDVGPLKPGRIIDLNEQAMRYFDPTMQRGVIKSVRVTPLLGEEWVAGPIGEDWLAGRA